MTEEFDISDAIGWGNERDDGEPGDAELLSTIEDWEWDTAENYGFADEERFVAVLNHEVQLNPDERRALRANFVEERESSGWRPFYIHGDPEAVAGERFVIVDGEECMMGHHPGYIRSSHATLEGAVAAVYRKDVVVQWVWHPIDDAHTDIAILFGRRVRKLRMDQSHTQGSFAAMTGLDLAYLDLIERGKRDVYLRNVDAIADALDIGIAEIFKDIGSEKRASDCDLD